VTISAEFMQDRGISAEVKMSWSVTNEDAPAATSCSTMKIAAEKS
jgi:hypothetical protein